MEATAIPVCPKCGNTIFPTDTFCANCGFQLVLQQSQPVSIGRQIYIYLVSFFLPPLGLIWTFKYFKSSIAGQKRIAKIAFVLTILSIIINFWIGFGVIAAVQKQISQYSSQINGYGL